MQKTQQFVLHAKDPGRKTVLQNLIAFLQRLPDDKPWRVEVKRHAKKRSDGQNRYLNGVAYKIISDVTGYERDDVSEYLCGQYFGWESRRVPGNEVAQRPVRTTTTDENGKRDVLSAKAFADYVDFVQRFASEHGIFIPDPGQVCFHDNDY